MSRRTRLVVIALLVSVIAVSSALAGRSASLAPSGKSYVGYPNSSAALTSRALTTLAKATTPGKNG